MPEDYWDTLYDELDDGDPDSRATARARFFGRPYWEEDDCLPDGTWV